MKKEDIAIAAQILTSIKDSIDKLEEEYNKNDMEGLTSAKREILNLQKEVEKLI